MNRAFAVVCVLFVAGFASSGTVAQDSKPAAKPKPKVYDEKADAKVDIAAAVTRAAADNKRVLVVFGANWCGWCVLLSDMFKSNPDIAKTLNYEYEVVKVDVGQFDKFTDITTAYGCELKQHGIPYLTVLDAAGKVLTNQDTGSLEAGPKHDPAKVVAFLDKWKAPPLDAEEVLKAALARAAKEKKKVMLHFGAPWCGWCHRFEEFFARPEPAAIMATDFLMVKVDEDRMTHGKDVEMRFRKGRGGIPWTVVLSETSEILGVSEDATGKNIGHPWEPAEVDVFIALLKKNAQATTADQIERLKTLLLAQRAEATPPPPTLTTDPNGGGGNRTRVPRWS